MTNAAKESIRQKTAELFKMKREADFILSQSYNIATHEMRHWVSVVRGYHDLAFYYLQDVNISDAYNALQKVRQLFGKKIPKMETQ